MMALLALLESIQSQYVCLSVDQNSCLSIQASKKLLSSIDLDILKIHRAILINSIKGLIVTPLQKIHVIEDYINAVHFVHNREGKYSMLRNLSIEEYREEKSKVSGV